MPCDNIAFELQTAFERRDEGRLKAKSRYLLIASGVVMAGIFLGCSSGISPTVVLPTELVQLTAESPPIFVAATPLQPDKTPVSTPIRIDSKTAISGPAVRIRDVVIPVELAIEPDDRRQGLSDRLSLNQGAGMLFIFEKKQSLRFWMRNMQFPLDIIWIDAECRLADVSRDVPVPPPGTDDSDLLSYGPRSEVRFVLEINAGETTGLGLEVGDIVEFVDPIDEEYGC